jgi:aminomethyltransferase
MSLTPILEAAAIAPLPTLGWIEVTGSDRVRWLNGMVTNNIAALQPGEGCYNFFLNAQGRIQTDATAFLLPDRILLETAAARIPDLIALLDRFIIMDDVELAHLEDRAGLLIAGPQAESLLESIGIHPNAQPLTLQSTPTCDLIYAHSPLVPCFELWATVERIAQLQQTLTQNSSSFGAAGSAPIKPQGADQSEPRYPSGPASVLSPEDLEHLRILSGTPLYGTDIRNSETSRDLPQETNQTRALHFAKGCYLGQEIVERIRSRGAVHRTFTAFTLTGELPPPGTALTAEGKTVGELTSVARIESTQIALGYLRREALDRALPLTYPGGTAIPKPLPS